jgi:primosomal protein N' (replication factor Y) (superfamily II helicase)
MHYADVILPLALPNSTYTYSVPDELVPLLQAGMRVEVQFGKSKLYSGLVARVHQETPNYRVKPILAILDEMAVVSPQQLQLWAWMADYYCCTLGEVMAAALPGHLKLTSETQLVRNMAFGDDFSELDAEEYLLAEAILLQPFITIEDARKILNKQTVFPVIQRLMHRGVLFLREDLQEKFKPRTVKAVRYAEPYASDPDRLRAVFDELAQSPAQEKLLVAFMQLQRSRPYVSSRELLRSAEVSNSPLSTLAQRGVLEVYQREVSRSGDYQHELVQTGQLSEQQRTALSAVNAHFNSGMSTVLLHGVTGSGKTQLYIELIRETLLQGGQVLYLLPEIALTTQIVGRLQRVFGGDIATYHSKINYNERVEVWRGAALGKPIILGARSGLFLPFQRLQLIIVDEEHDPSFKQYDPAPRYQARDTAIYLAGLYGAKVLLGTATPSVESYYNATTGKYGLVELNERFGGAQLPEVELIDLGQQQKTKQMHSLFSAPLLEQLKAALAKGEQAILFQNRRGYAPILECQTCGWTQMCRHCDVSLTYHKHYNRLRCHYCGFQAEVPETCPACGSGKLVMMGFGTEKIEDELRIFLPDARIGRLDMDTAGTKNGLTSLLNDFDERELDILVGTQMVTKGLDFENVALVGVLAADQLIRFPDFRSSERAYQLMTQVAGRAGRKKSLGKVLIQAYATQHPVIQEVQTGDFQAFIKREMEERQTFRYPPFARLIHLHIAHKEEKIAAAAANFMAAGLRSKLGPERVLGPVLPPVPRVRNFYGQNIMLKLEKSAPIIQGAKQLIKIVQEQLLGRQGWGQVKISIDVDPV